MLLSEFAADILPISAPSIQVRLPPRQEEIAAGAFENLFWVELLLLGPDSMPRFCPCMFAKGGSGCLRRLRMSRMRYRPRQREGGARAVGGRDGSSERDDGSGDDDGDGGSHRSGPVRQVPHGLERERGRAS